VRAALLTAPRTFELAQVADPAPEAGEVLVRVGACGVCASDLPWWTGEVANEEPNDTTYPRPLGHEVSGSVEAVGPGVTDLAEGDRVAVFVTEGGYADLVAVPGDRCVAVGEMPLELALGEPVACAVNAVELAAPALGDDVAIVGAGFMGSLVQLLVELRGPRHVIVADVRRDALERAKRLGATRTVDLGSESLADAVGELTDGRGVDVSFEVTGVQAGLDAVGSGVTRMGGTVAIVGFHRGPTRTLPLGDWNWHAFRIVNGHIRDVPTILAGMRAGMRLVAMGRLPLDGLVTDRVGLEDVGEAFALLERHPDGFVKATVIP